MVVVNTNTIEGATIKEYKTLVTSHKTVGIGFVTAIVLAVFNLIGKPCPRYDTKVEMAKKAAIDDIIQKAETAGANVILNVHFQVFTTSVLAVGTAVVAE